MGTGDKRGGIAISISLGTSYAELYNDLQNKLNVDPSQYNMELKFKFNEHASVLIPLIMISSVDEVNYLIELNNKHTTPLCVTLVRNDIVEDEQVDSRGGDHNANDFWDIMEIAHGDDVVIPEIIAHRIPSAARDNENEMQTLLQTMT